MPSGQAVAALQARAAFVAKLDAFVFGAAAPFAGDAEGAGGGILRERAFALRLVLGLAIAVARFVFAGVGAEAMATPGQSHRVARGLVLVAFDQ